MSSLNFTARLARALSLALVGATLIAASLRAEEKPSALRLDYAYYNPVSLVLKEKGTIEAELATDGIKVEWVQTVEDLKGKSIAVTRGTDPHIFLLRALGLHGLGAKDVRMVLLQHPDGKAALEKGDVDAWAGLDPHMAQTELEQGSRLFFRNPDLNTYGFLNVREDFVQRYPELVVRVLRIYEATRQWSVEHPDELRAIVAKVAKLSDAVAARTLERNDLSSGRIGDAQRQAIVAAGGALKENGVIPADTDVEAVARALIDPQYVERALAKKQVQN